MSGHGHVKPNADGTVARCGGPKICSVCALELAALNLNAGEFVLKSSYDALVAENESRKLKYSQLDDINIKLNYEILALRAANAELVEVLKNAQETICSEFCGQTHHEVCDGPRLTLAKYGAMPKDPGLKSDKK